METGLGWHPDCACVLEGTQYDPHLFQMQYVFIYQALLEHYLYGDTELEVTSLEIHLQKIYNKVPGTSSNGLEEEFKVGEPEPGCHGSLWRGERGSG